MARGADATPLAKSTVVLTIEPATNFRQRECDVAVVPLTRSHTHRAVPYGDDPSAIPLALTRAGQRVIVVGDAGTLTRRAQWDGPLDHLDGATAAREKAWVAASSPAGGGNLRRAPGSGCGSPT